MKKSKKKDKAAEAAGFIAWVALEVVKFIGAMAWAVLKGIAYGLVGAKVLRVALKDRERIKKYGRGSSDE